MSELGQSETPKHVSVGDSFRRKRASRPPSGGAGPLVLAWVDSAGASGVILSLRISRREGGMHRQRLFVLMMALAAAATSALGQDAAPAVGPANSGTQSAASIPDFSGTWVYPFCCGFAPPQSGPSPVVNKLRRRQVAGADGLRLPAGANAPLTGNPSQMVGDHTDPILKPQAAEVRRLAACRT
jgi:hypothetical protein